MFKNILFTATILASFGIFSPANAQKTKHHKKEAAKSDVKFLDDIVVSAAPVSNDPKSDFSKSQFSTDKPVVLSASPVQAVIENADHLQFKYALLLDEDVEQVQNLNLFKSVDEWFGTRYKLGGNTKDGIDCSALMQALFASVYAISLPRTAREQYDFSRHISRTELKEGDLVFFNTIGGVSHVGMYLQNNKFVHASSGGVTISDLYDEYWMKRFVGVGRIDTTKQATASTLNP